MHRAALYSAVLILLLFLPGMVQSDGGGNGASSGGAPSNPGALTSTAGGAAVVPAYRQANKVAVLRVEGVIDRVTLQSLERRFEKAMREGAGAIVLDINTPGGEVTATLDICHLLKTDAPPNTVAWINPNAYSAGTFIALAAREIVLQDNASFGDAAPIQATPWGGLVQLEPTERAKLEAPLLEEVIDSARRHHYDEKLVQAFVSVGVELWLLEHKQTGERVFVDRTEYRAVFGDDPPAELTSVTPSIDADSHRQVRPAVTERVREGEAAPQGEFRQQLPSPRAQLTAADRDDYRVLRQVTAADRLLTLRPDEARLYGLATRIIRNDQELMAYFGAQELVRYDQLWSESLARFLMSYPVRAVLIVIFLVALFIELSAPGIGVFGAAAGVALLLLLGAPALVGLAQWWGILLVAIGLALLAAELFIIPGMGVAGVLGLLSLFVGIVGTFVTGDLGTSEGQYQLWAGIATIITSAFGAGIIIWLLSRQFHSVNVLDKVILKSELGAKQTTAAGAAVLEAVDRQDGELLVGELGVAHTGLRPAGRAAFGHRIVDVQSLGGFIEKGTPVRIVSIDKYVIEVEEVDE